MAAIEYIAVCSLNAPPCEAVNSRLVEKLQEHCSSGGRDGGASCEVSNIIEKSGVSACSVTRVGNFDCIRCLC